jgi:glycosyltransferase involved in cell wall biosynthesis
MKNKLNDTVIIFGPEIWSLQENGGVSRYCHELIRNLDLIGVNVRVLVGPNENNYTRLIDPRVKVTLNSLSESEIHRGISEALLNSNLGIYHSTYYDSTTMRIAQKRGLKTVVTVYDLIGELFPTKIAWYRRRSTEQKRVVKQSDLVISISENTKSDLMDLNKISSSKVKVVPLGVSDFGDQLDSDIYLEKPYILHVGKRQEYKNFIFTVESIARCVELSTLNIIAFGGEKPSEEELVAISNLQMEFRVNFLHGDDEFLGYLYKNAFALVYPSLYEGFGIPPLEAMRHYCPVIASTRGSIPEVCGTYAKYFDPTLESSLQSQLKELLEGPDDSYLRKAYEHSLDFTWERTAIETFSAYKALVGDLK